MADAFIAVAGVGEAALAEAALHVEPRRRDAGGPLHRHAGATALSHRGRSRCERDCHSLLSAARACPASICPAAACARARSTPCCAGRACRARRRRRSSRRPWSASRAPAARRWRWRKTACLLGVIHLKDVVKPDIRPRFAQLRAMGIKTVMVTGDNPLDRRGHRLGGRRRRFPRRGDAGGQAQLHPPRAAGRSVDRHVRRRNQRRAGARAGRCRRRHADRHAGRARGRQHGRPRFRSDQADRDRRHRQTTLDDARRADHLLDRQRRRQIFRHHPRAIRDSISASWRRST